MIGKKRLALLTLGMMLLTLGCARQSKQTAPQEKPGASAAAKVETAEEKMRRRLQAQGQSSDDYEIRTAPLLGRAMLVEVTEKNISPAIPEVYLLNRFGHLKPFAFIDLVMAFHDDYPPCESEADQLRLANEVIRLHDRCTNGRGSKVIRTAREIPGYEKAPLPPDLAGMIRAPWKQAGDGPLVLYTWRQADGEVRRYSFAFDRDGRLSVDTTCMILGRRIGDAGAPLI